MIDDLEPGDRSSEYRKTHHAAIAGMTTWGIGLAFCLVAVVLSAPGCFVAGAVGIGLSITGGFVVSHTTAAYSASRATVKAASMLPDHPATSPTVVNNHTHATKIPPRGI